uniref:Uncharacterized protein n=1 Tax=Anguilla anguilla TaxID=7936 RepID=A0A0E9WZF0_ANGAN
MYLYGRGINADWRVNLRKRTRFLPYVGRNWKYYWCMGKPGSLLFPWRSADVSSLISCTIADA